MKEIDMLLRFLRYTTSLPVFCWDGKAQMLKKTEKQFCFSEQAQPLLTAQGLQTVLEHMQPSYLYEVEDLLGIHYLSFLFQSESIVVGPFADKEWSDTAAEICLTGVGLPTSYLMPYKLYYCSYVLMNQRAVIQVVTGAITALLPDVPPFIYRKISGTLGHRLPDLYSRETLDFDSVVQRYALENEFLDLIAEGRSEAALDSWGRLGKIPGPEELSDSGPQGALADATVLRTLVRKAAERGGVHPATIDAISLSYAQKMYAAHSVDEFRQIIFAMIQEFSEAVSTAQAMRYSPAITRTVNYLHLHISQELDMKRLAALANCTSNHLGRQFKSETGLTIAQYLAKERCHKAAELLAHTDLPVQDISAHVGYLDNNYFAKIFKSCIGDTPTAYRRKFRR